MARKKVEKTSKQFLLVVFFNDDLEEADHIEWFDTIEEAETKGREFMNSYSAEQIFVFSLAGKFSTIFEKFK